MKALINLDREATLEILKSLNVDIKPEIVDNYKKLVQREIELYCENQLHNALDNYVKHNYILRQSIEEAIKSVKSKILTDQYTKTSRYVEEYLNQVKELYEKDLERKRTDLKEINVESIIRDQVDKSVKNYLATKFK